MLSELDSLLEAPCKELKPVEPFPFKSNRISRGVRFQHYLILFPFYPEYKKCQHLYTFNLFTRRWGSVQLRNSPEILENTDNYKIISDEKDGFILFGCYKAFQANTTGNLFFQSQAMTLKKTLGWISAQIDQGELTLQWKECEGADQLPYREKFSAYITSEKDQRKYIYIFGGCDENGKVTDDLYDFDFEKKVANKMELVSTRLGGKDNLPCARMSHGCTSRGWIVIFGGEDQNSNMINDIWNFLLISADEHLAQCNKFNKRSTNRCPKLGTPCFWYETPRKDFLLHIAKSTTQVLPPFRNYLCAEVFDHTNDETTIWSQKEPLPFDGVPHTMEIFENRLILGFESAIYSIDFGSGTDPAPAFESYFEASHDVMVTKKIRQKSFKGHMRQYFEEKPFPDVKFKVQGKEISAHRGILSVRCPFFGELFGAGSKDESQSLEITDLSPAGFNALLEWLYCNEILDFKDEVAIEVLKVTNKYSLPKLKTEAEKCLMKNLTAENLLERAKLAVEFNARELETAVVNYIVKEMNDVKRQEELKNFPDSIQERVCNMEKISDDSFAAKLHKIKWN